MSFPLFLYLFSFRVDDFFLQNNTYHRWNPKPKISDPTIRKMWDPSKSPSVNLASLGLVAKPNQDVHRQNTAAAIPSETPDVIEMFDIPDSDELKRIKSERRLPLSEEDQKYIAKCMSKHGDDYSKMFRDIKTNYMQHTETQLKKMGSRFLLLTAEQRAVELPERVKRLAHE